MGFFTSKKINTITELYSDFLRDYVQYLVNDEKEINIKIEEIKKKTNQNLKVDQLRKEIWILRYATLHIWFFDLVEPKNQEELDEQTKLINHTFKVILESNSEYDYFSLFSNGLVEYFKADKLRFNDLKNFKSHWGDKLKEKLVHIPFECTEGRLAGELHDFIVELLMRTIKKDFKSFQMEDNTLTKEEIEDIKKTIKEAEPTKEETEKALIEAIEEVVGHSGEQKTMTLKQAEKVLYDEYAEFLQSDTNRFGAIFPITPPVSFYPYHPKHIKEAINILKTDCEKKGEVSKIKAIENVEPFLWHIKEDEECMVKLVEDVKWRDLSFKLVKDFQKNPNQISYIEKYLEGESFDKIDFNNLNTNTAKKLSEIVNLFFKNSYLLLNIIFETKVPESLLPFSKTKLIKLIDFLIEFYNSANKNEEVEAYTFMKNYITDEYIDDEIAMKEFINNISNKDNRDSIILNLQNHQTKKIEKLFS